MVRNIASSMKWPARTSEMIVGDNCLWGYTKDIVSKQRFHYNNGLKAAAVTEFGTISPAVLRKMFYRAWRRKERMSDSTPIHCIYNYVCY